MTKIEFTDKEIEELHYQRFHRPHPRVQQRMEALYLKGLDYPHQDIGRIVGVSQKTLRGYLRMYQTGGIEALKKLNFYQPRSDLDQHQEERVAEIGAGESLGGKLRVLPPPIMRGNRGYVKCGRLTL